MRLKRPFGVTIIAILQALSAPTSGLFLLQSHMELHLLLMDVRLVIVATAITIIGLVIAAGLWGLKRWAWSAVMIWTGVNLAGALFGYFHGQPDYAAMAEGIVVVFYLNQRDVRRAFESAQVEQEVRHG
jgi:uncharacterized membrane protein (DUF2068 family)